LSQKLIDIASICPVSRKPS